MDFKNKLKQTLDNTAGSIKGKVDNSVQEYKESQEERKLVKQEEQKIKNAFVLDKQVGPLKVDFGNEWFVIDNIEKLKSNILTKTVALSTLGISTVIRKASHDGDSKIYDFTDLIDFELMEDDTSISSGGLGRAVVGGALLGGVGAIVGSNTGGKKSKRVIHSLILKITLNDQDNPCIMYDFIKKPLKSTSKDYQKLFKTAHEATALLGLITTKANESIDTIEQKEVIEVISDSSDPYEELKKAKELLDMGVITEEEFEIKKKELLGL